MPRLKSHNRIDLINEYQLEYSTQFLVGGFKTFENTSQKGNLSQGSG